METCQRLYFYEPLGLSLVVGVTAGMLAQALRQRSSAGDSPADEVKISGLNEVITMAVVSIVGAVVGSAFLSGGGLSVAIGLLIGLWLAFIWSGGLAGLALSGLGALASWALGSSQGALGWLSFGAGFGLGMIPNLLGSINFVQAYKNRGWYFWWREPPPAYKVELALQLAQQTRPDAIWEEPLRRLALEDELPTPPAVLVDRLQSQNWLDRFVARHAIVTIGGQAAEALKTVAIDRHHPLWETALGLLACIERETSTRYGWRAPYLLCPHCLARFSRREVELWLGVSFTYYGCRLCGQSRKFLDCPAGVTAVLDTTWPEPLSYHDGLLRVNYLTRPVLFDFDRVEIVRAGDEEVERLAMRAGNDTDPFRVGRYQQMPCLVRPGAGLSENSVRVLDKIFGRVERG